MSHGSCSPVPSGRERSFRLLRVCRQSWGRTCVDLCLRCSLLCSLPPGAELLFIFPRDCASGLFGDTVVASLGGVWSAL